MQNNNSNSSDNISSEDNENDSNGRSPNINKDLTSTVRYSRLTDKKKAKNDHKSLLTRIPRLNDCNHLFYIVKEHQSSE